MIGLLYKSKYQGKLAESCAPRVSRAEAKEIKTSLDDEGFRKLIIEPCQLYSQEKENAGNLTLTRAVQPEGVTNMQGKTKGR